MALLDIHSHHRAPYYEGIISVDPKDFKPVEGQLYSVGIHPWTTLASPAEEDWEKLEMAAASSQTVAIGECGVDTLKGGPMFRQLQVFRRQVEVSEKFGKPLIIHDVKAHDIITGLKRDLNPKQTWIVHGFRGKPTVARMLLDAGIMLSFGELFNAESLRNVPLESLFSETDESDLSIEEIIKRLGDAYGCGLEAHIKENILRVFNLQGIQY